MRKTLQASILVLALYCPVLAGDISTPSSTQPPPPPPPSPTTEGQTIGGEIGDEAPTPLAETLLSVIESVLALL
jgi:hypothetical protein